MATPVMYSPIRVMEGETASLTTTASYLALKPAYHEVKLYCASSWRMALSPALRHVVYNTGTTYTEYVQNATDRSSSTHVPLDAMPATDILYLGTSEPVRGFYFDIGTNVQAEAATLDMEYCSTAVALGATLAFSDVAGDSDGTTSGGATLAVDGAYTFNLPSVKKSVLGTYAIPLFSDCYWTRFKPSATLSATVDINEIIPIYQNTNYAYMEAGVEYQFSINQAQVGALVLQAVEGTPTLNVTWIRH